MRRFGTRGGADGVERVDGVGAGVSADGRVRRARLEVIADRVRDRAAEDDEVEEGVGAQAVGPVHGDAGGFAAGVEARDHDVVALGVDVEDLAGVFGRDAAHVVVHGRQDGDGLLGDVDAGEDGGRFRNAGEALVQDVGGQVGELEVDVVLVGTDAAALADFHGHGAGDDVAAGEVLGRGGVPLHEALALGVEEIAALAARALGDEAAGAVDARGVELDKLHVLIGEASARDHGHAVARARVRRSAAKVGTAVSAGCQDGMVRPEAVEGAVFLVIGDHALALSVFHYQIEGKVFNKVVGIVP